jgi:Sporulation and spore germination
VSRGGPGAVVAILLGVVAMLAGCAIQPNSSPRDVAPDQRPPLDVAGAAAGPSAGTGRVFLVVLDEAGESRLRSVQRPATAAESVLAALFDGPNREELNDGLETALPPELELLAVRQSAGTLTVDVSEEMLELTSTDLPLAVAQIVFTSNELDSVRAVNLLVEGARREWPNARGELQSDLLTVYDFPGLAESVQPAFPPVPSS